MIWLRKGRYCSNSNSDLLSFLYKTLQFVFVNEPWWCLRLGFDRAWRCLCLGFDRPWGCHPTRDVRAQGGRTPRSCPGTSSACVRVHVCGCARIVDAKHFYNWPLLHFRTSDFPSLPTVASKGFNYPVEFQTFICVLLPNPFPIPFSASKSFF